MIASDVFMCQRALLDHRKGCIYFITSFEWLVISFLWEVFTQCENESQIQEIIWNIEFYSVSIERAQVGCKLLSINQIFRIEFKWICAANKTFQRENIQNSNVRCLKKWPTFTHSFERLLFIVAVNVTFFLISYLFLRFINAYFVLCVQYRRF